MGGGSVSILLPNRIIFLFNKLLFVLERFSCKCGKKFRMFLVLHCYTKQLAATPIELKPIVTRSHRCSHHSLLHVSILSFDWLTGLL